MIDPREVLYRIRLEEAAVELAVAVEGVYHRGYRFFPPFVCGACGDPISVRQFAFSRSCGGCDVNRSTTRRFSPYDHRRFLGGRVVLEDGSDRWRIHPVFIPAAEAKNYPRIAPRVPPRPLPKPRGMQGGRFK